MQERNINEDLMAAVASHNLEVVRDSLAKGADPNYTRDTEYPNASIQPTSPLRLVVFCISDNMLEDSDLNQFAEIATLLLQHGADPKPAMQLAELRYGKYDHNSESSPFMNVWRIIANAK